jgi:uncharacterized protein (TIGR02594 family)
MTKTRYRVRASKLNIREAPKTASSLLGELHKDDILERIDESDDGKWIKFQRDGMEGWCVKGFLEKLAPVVDFPWMPIAEKERGISETPGLGNTARVVEYLKATTNLGSAARAQDETPWCSAFVNWCLEQAGIKGTGSALARSWLDWGQAIDTPRRGCIVVFSREKVFGHVGFYLDETETEIKVLGGNQQDAQTKIYQVSEKYYPKSALLGYRVPK